MLKQIIISSLFFLNLFSVELFSSSNPDFIKQVEGTYAITYTVTDSFNKSTTAKRIVIIKKNKKPVIKLNGEKQIFINQDSNFVDPGFSAFDEEDGDITKKVIVQGEVDTSTIGEYTLIYTVTDSFGQKVSVNRDVIVYSVEKINPKVLEQGNVVSINLWDYLFHKKNDSLNVKTYLDGYYAFSHLHSFSSSNDNSFSLFYDYTSMYLKYFNLGDYFNIDFYIDDNKIKTVSLKNHINLNDTITTIEPSPSKKCVFSNHYNKISLGGTDYSDVIKLTCGNVFEAYFQKNRGMILQNNLLSISNYTIDVNSLKSNNTDNIDINDYSGGLIFDDSYTSNKFKTLNLSSAIKMNVDKLWKDPYNLNGEGITVGLVDGGSVLATHQEFADGRVVNETSLNSSPHSTHVAGTIIATGIKKEAHGFANKARLHVLDYLSFPFHYGMEELWKQNILISNHSYGISEPSYIGEYDSYASAADKFVTEHPFCIAIKSAGNDRNDSENYPYYANIKSFSNAKNILTIGSVDEDNTISDFSSVGPAEHGRIKPDFVSKGFQLYSTSNTGDDDYVYLGGTSMAAPGATGVVALMEERYNQINYKNMRVDNVKSILANTSVDLGRKGPDYEYGFGLIDALAAIKVIDTMETPNTLVQDKLIDENSHHLYHFSLSSSGYFNAALSWIDPTDNKINSYLYTNLDFFVKNINTHQIYFPFSLDGRQGHEEDLATSDTPNNIDNIEQMRVYLPAGDYELYIIPSYMIGPKSQNYTLTTNVPLNGFTDLDSSSPFTEFETFIYNSIY